MTSQVENLRQTYDRTYDNLMTNRKIFFVIWPHEWATTTFRWFVGVSYWSKKTTVWFNIGKQGVETVSTSSHFGE